ncbi:BolA family protein [Terricaulis silvestris]|nr:BolA family protein [Terricaulis silvestris]
MTDNKTHLSRFERMETLLKTAFTPSVFELQDQSRFHAGHAGASPGGETHYKLSLVSTAFEGLNRVARQRLVYQALHEEFDTGLHALSLDLKTPAEAGSA